MDSRVASRQPLLLEEAAERAWKEARDLQNRLRFLSEEVRKTKERGRLLAGWEAWKREHLAEPLPKKDEQEAAGLVEAAFKKPPSAQDLAANDAVLGRGKVPVGGKEHRSGKSGNGSDGSAVGSGGMGQGRPVEDDFDPELAEEEAHFEAVGVLGRVGGPLPDKRELDDAIYRAIGVRPRGIIQYTAGKFQATFATSAEAQRLLAAQMSIQGRPVILWRWSAQGC